MVNKDIHFVSVPWYKHPVRSWFGIDLKSGFKSIWLGPILIIFSLDEEGYVDHLSVAYYPDLEVASWSRTFINYWKK